MVYVIEVMWVKRIHNKNKTQHYATERNHDVMAGVKQYIFS
jgi:hypothetical protein